MLGRDGLELGEPDLESEDEGQRERFREDAHGLRELAQLVQAVAKGEVRAGPVQAFCVEQPKVHSAGIRQTRKGGANEVVVVRDVVDDRRALDGEPALVGGGDVVGGHGACGALAGGVLYTREYVMGWN